MVAPSGDHDGPAAMPFGSSGWPTAWTTFVVTSTVKTPASGAPPSSAGPPTPGAGGGPPSGARAKAIAAPSGDQLGPVSSPGPLVSCSTADPSAFAT